MMEYESKMSQIHQRNTEKLDQQRHKEENRQRDLIKSQKRAD